MSDNEQTPDVDVDQLCEDLKAFSNAFFALNIGNILEKPMRLGAIAQAAGIPPERVPALRKLLVQLSKEGLQ